MITKQEKILNDFCEFLEKGGYLDSDWREEGQSPVHDFIREQFVDGVKMFAKVDIFKNRIIELYYEYPNDFVQKKDGIIIKEITS